MTEIELVTAEELYRLGPEARFELIDGKLVEYPLHGGVHGLALTQLACSVGSYVRDNRLGTLYLAQVGHILRRDPDTVVAPDLSFIRTERDTDEGDGFLTVVPDLVIEVVESYETTDWIEDKVQIYLEAGVGQVWVVDPAHARLWVHQNRRVGWRIWISTMSSRVTDVLPGFELRVSDLFA